jgi:hypothetical protein
MSIIGGILGGGAAYADKRTKDATSLLSRENSKRATEMKGEQVIELGRTATDKMNLKTQKRKIERAKQQGMEGVKGRRGAERGSMASTMGTTPTTEGTRAAEFREGFKDPKTQFQAENAGNAFADQMRTASKGQEDFNNQLASYGGMAEGYKDLNQSNKIKSGEIAGNIAGGAEDQSAISTDAALAQQHPDYALDKFSDRDARFKKKMYDKYYSLRTGDDWGGLNPNDKAPMLGVNRRIKGSALGAGMGMAGSLLGPGGLGII